MAELELFHRIFTHAQAAGFGTGGRFAEIDRNAAGVLPKEAARELDDLLKKLVPYESDRAWAMRRFSGDGASYACLAVSYEGFADAVGRPGLLNHARVVKLDPKERWFNPLPLIASALELRIGDVLVAPPQDRLRTYLDRMMEEATLPVPEMNPAMLDDVPRELAIDVLVASFAELGKRRGIAVRAPDGVLQRIAVAWAAMPAGMQERSSWAVDAADGVPVDLIWSSRGGEAPRTIGSQALPSFVATYLDRIGDLGPVVRNPKIRNEVELQAQIARINIEVGPRTAGKGEMAKTGSRSQEGHAESQKPMRTGEVGPLDFEVIENLDRQHEAIYRSLQDYITKRLAAYETRAAAAVPRGGTLAQPEGGGWWKRFGVFAATAALAVAVTLLAVKYWPRGDRVENTPPTNEVSSATGTTETEATTTSNPAESVVTPFIRKAETATTDRKWADAFAELNKTQPAVLARLVDQVAAGQDTQAAARRKLEDFSKRLKAPGNPLNGADREALRPILFEYVAKLDAADRSVDGKLNDIDTALLKAIQSEWQLQSAVSDVNSWDLHSELILRWLERNP